MNIDRHAEALRTALQVSGQAASPEVAQAAELLSRAIEPAIRLTLLEVLAEAAAEVNEAIGGAVVVDVRLRGAEPELVVGQGADQDFGPSATPADAPAPSTPAGGEDLSARISLRLSERLKTQVEGAASAAGVSVNTWLVRAAQGAIAGPEPLVQDRGRRMTGWVR